MDKYTPEFLGKSLEHISEAQRQLAEQVNRIVEASLRSATRLVELNMRAAQEGYQRNIRLIGEAKGLKDGKDLADLQERIRQAETDALVSQAERLNKLFREAQDEMEQIARDGFQKVNSQMGEALGQPFAFPGSDLVRQGFEAQREAFEKASELARDNWQQSVDQMRKMAEQGAEQIREAQAKARGG